MIASPISSSGSSSPKPSIMTTAFSVLATTRSRSLFSSSSAVGNATSWPSTRPSRTAPMGPWNGTRAITRAAEAPMIDRTSASFGPVGGDRPGLDLDLVAIGLGEQRTNRPVDEPRRQDLLGRRPPLALDEAAGELAGGVDLLAVVDRQREEVEALAAGAGDDGDERHGVADPDDHGTAGLLGEVAGLDAQDLAADVSLDMVAGIGVLDMDCTWWNWCLSSTRSTRTCGWIGWREGERSPSGTAPRPPYRWTAVAPAARGLAPRRPGATIEGSTSGTPPWSGGHRDRIGTHERVGERTLLRQDPHHPRFRGSGEAGREWGTIGGTRRPRAEAEGQDPAPDRHLRMPSRLITSRYFFRSCSRRYFSKLDRLGDHHQQPAAAGMVLGMRLEVLGQVIDPGRQQGDLHFGRPRILPAPAKAPDELRLFLLRDRHLSPQYHRPSRRGRIDVTSLPL